MNKNNMYCKTISLCDKCNHYPCYCNYQKNLNNRFYYSNWCCNCNNDTLNNNDIFKSNYDKCLAANDVNLSNYNKKCNLKNIKHSKNKKYKCYNKSSCYKQNSSCKNLNCLGLTSLLLFALFI